MTPREISELREYLTPAEREEFDALIRVDKEQVFWRSLPGPQTMARESKADVIGYGGAAGGGKTELAIGMTLMDHHETLILRREATQLKGILRRLEVLLGGRDGYNGQEKRWYGAGPRGVSIEFGSCPNLGDETKHQGNPHDFLVFDETANFLESQVNFLLGWNRTTRENVRCRALMTFNPPTTTEGRWIIDFFAPWLDKRHALYPTAPGELRYVVTVPGDNDTFKYIWVDDDTPCVIEGGELIYDFDPSTYAPEDIVTPQSRTFIPSRISDNPYLANSGYLRVLQAMPEPLRSQLLYGDFQAGMTDSPWQVIPTAWVDAAMARWTERAPRGEMMSMGVDVARGGKDNTVIATRHRTKDHAHWFDRLKLHPGKATPSGQTTAGLVLAERRDGAPMHLDVIGVGASPYDILHEVYPMATIGVNVSEAATGKDKSGRLSFTNLRSELWWRMRELLDPENDTGVALPPDPELAKELCAPLWQMRGFTIYVESREEIVARIGRSPDRATAVILANMETPKIRDLERRTAAETVRDEYNPYANLR